MSARALPGKTHCELEEIFRAKAGNTDTELTHVDTVMYVWFTTNEFFLVSIMESESSRHVETKVL